MPQGNNFSADRLPAVDKVTHSIVVDAGILDSHWLT